jgi:hypothetical protein
MVDFVVVRGTELINLDLVRRIVQDAENTKITLHFDSHDIETLEGADVKLFMDAVSERQWVKNNALRAARRRVHDLAQSGA